MANVAIVAFDLVPGGVSRFIHELLSALDQHETNHQLTVYSNDQDLPASWQRLRVIHVSGRADSWRTMWRLRQQLQRDGVDTVIYPKTLIPFAHIGMKVARVPIVHDLVYYARGFREFSFLDRCRFRLNFPVTLSLASRLVCISNATRDDLLDRFPRIKAPVTVCHEALPQLPEPASSTTSLPVDLTRPYLFYCGSLSPRKNMLNVLRAFREICDEVPHHFYIASYASWRDGPVRQFVADELADRVHLLERVSDADLTALYRSAAAFVYVSRYEGFGLPILEAQAHGCPLLTSNRTSCPEIAGQGALVVDADDVDDMTKQMRRLLSEPELQDNLRRLGRENLKRFSWAKTAEIILQAVA